MPSIAPPSTARRLLPESESVSNRTFCETDRDDGRRSGAGVADAADQRAFSAFVRPILFVWAFDIAGFSALSSPLLSSPLLSDSLPPFCPCSPGCHCARRPPARRVMSPGGHGRNIKSISEQRYLSSRNYRGIYGHVSFVDCNRELARWAEDAEYEDPKRSGRSDFCHGRAGRRYLSH